MRPQETTSPNLELRNETSDLHGPPSVAKWMHGAVQPVTSSLETDMLDGLVVPESGTDRLDGLGRGMGCETRCEGRVGRGVGGGMEGPRKRVTRTEAALEDGKHTPAPEGAKAFVRLRGWIAETGEALDPGEEEEVRQVMLNDDEEELPGVRMALEGIRPGQTVQLEFEPKTKQRRRKKSPTPDAPLPPKVIYEVELLDWEDPDHAKPRGVMFFEERIEAAKERKERGNESYKKKNWRDACTHYDIGLSYLPPEYVMQVEGNHLDQVNQVRIPLLVNLSACKMQTEDWNGVILDTTEALVTGGENLKALYRRALARFKLGQTDEAEEDIRMVLEREPKDPAALKLMRDIQQEREQILQSQKKRFAGMFAPPPDHVQEPPVEPPEVDFDDIPDVVLEEDEKIYLNDTPWYWRMLGY